MRRSLWRLRAREAGIARGQPKPRSQSPSSDPASCVRCRRHALCCCCCCCCLSRPPAGAGGAAALRSRMGAGDGGDYFKSRPAPMAAMSPPLSLGPSWIGPRRFIAACSAPNHATALLHCGRRHAISAPDEGFAADGAIFVISIQVNVLIRRFGVLPLHCHPDIARTSQCRCCFRAIHGLTRDEGPRARHGASVGQSDAHRATQAAAQTQGGTACTPSMLRTKSPSCKPA